MATDTDAAREAEREQLIGKAVNRLWDTLWDMGDRLSDEGEERWLLALDAYAEPLCQADDTLETLAERLHALLPLNSQGAPPWEEEEGTGWKALMDHMRGGLSSTAPEPVQVEASALPPPPGEAD